MKVAEPRVFILTHYPRERIDMSNGTVFLFITEGVDRAIELSREAANGRDVRIGGGAQTIQQFMERGLLDEIHVAQVLVTLGSGEKLFKNKSVELKNYRAAPPVISDSIVHQTYLRN